jgi:hypothetical protein
LKFRRTGLAFLLAGALHLPDPAFSQEKHSAAPSEALDVHVSMGDCLGTEMEALLRKLTIEISALPPDVIEWMRRIRPEVHAFCDSNTLKIRVVDPTSGEYLEQNIEVEEAVSKALSRYVALVVVELISASEEDLAAEKHAAQPPAAPSKTPEPAAEKTVKPEPPWLRFVAAPVLWFGGSPIWLSGGGSVGLELSAVKWFEPALDMEVVWGRSNVTTGEIDALLISGAPLALFRFPTEKMRLLAGLGFRIGGVVWVGRPGRDVGAVGETKTLPWHGPCADVQASFPVSRVLELGLSIQGGWFSLESHALVFDRREMSLAGGWIRAGLSLKMKLL